ncbi:hypothetical protein BDW22DRAFT_1352680 [Trametopsis cervina]|nr:hypothetical protein BDW22DRAFT_1352680 [Trametopsis cervina]
MAVPTLPPDTPPDEVAAWTDYRANLWEAFRESYDEKWDQSKWDAAVLAYSSRYAPSVLARLRSKSLLPPWPALATQLRRGPPPFLRPGWVSPLQGARVALDWLDRGPDAFVRVRGTIDGWRNASVLVIEFWASWCKPCHEVFEHLSRIAATQPDTKVISFAHEGIFNNAETDVPALAAFVAARRDIDYPVFVDHRRVAFNALFKPGQNASIPLVFIITVKDSIVRWVGNAEEMAKPLADARAILGLA